MQLVLIHLMTDLPFLYHKQKTKKIVIACFLYSTGGCFLDNFFLDGCLLDGCSLWLKIFSLDQFYNEITVQVKVPIQMDYSNWNWLVQLKWTIPFKWTIPIQMDYSNWNGLFQLKWTIRIQIDYSNSNELFQLK